jgi:hypothetical protein
MRSQAGMWALVLIAMTGPQALGGEPGACEPPQQRFVQRLHPVGGWDPYGGGLLHWWNPHCFPRYCAPDDYCRKPLPRVCCPPGPPHGTWGPPGLVIPGAMAPGIAARRVEN